MLRGNACLAANRGPRFWKRPGPDARFSSKFQAGILPPPPRPGDNRAVAGKPSIVTAMADADGRPGARNPGQIREPGAKAASGTGQVRRGARGEVSGEAPGASATGRLPGPRSSGARGAASSTRSGAGTRSTPSAGRAKSTSPGSTPPTTARRGRGLPRTLSFDIGGTGLKASVLSKDGELLHTPVRTPTPYPLRPEQLVSNLVELTTGLPSFQRVSAGFPGMVRGGHLLSAPHFISPAGPFGTPTPELEKAWADFDLQQALETALGRPCRVANDADVQGSALVKGEGLEFVITLGTGVGTALFWRGKLAPHIELAHHPLGKNGRSYNEVLGEAAFQKVGHKKWNSRVASMLTVAKNLVFFDHCYIGGGNSTKVRIDLPADVSLASNTAGIIGGVKLWERI
jgi:polyphosphate glucokinase